MWFHKHIHALIPPSRPILLLIDGHSSHYSSDVIRMAVIGSVEFCEEYVRVKVVS